MPIERHYTGAELAELLGIDYETVLHKAHTGEIASVRVGRLRRFPESAVRDYLDRHTQDTNVIPLRPRDTRERCQQEAR
jgi:excisionase family DNA binding protein